MGLNWSSSKSKKKTKIKTRTSSSVYELDLGIYNERIVRTLVSIKVYPEILETIYE